MRIKIAKKTHILLITLNSDELNESINMNAIAFLLTDHKK